MIVALLHCLMGIGHWSVLVLFTGGNMKNVFVNQWDNQSCADRTIKDVWLPMTPLSGCVAINDASQWICGYQ